jgi:hypothetical protein
VSPAWLLTPHAQKYGWKKRMWSAVDKAGRRIALGGYLGCGMCRERFSPMWLNSVSRSVPDENDGYVTIFTLSFPCCSAQAAPEGRRSLLFFTGAAAENAVA